MGSRKRVVFFILFLMLFFVKENDLHANSIVRESGNFLNPQNPIRSISFDCFDANGCGYVNKIVLFGHDGVSNPRAPLRTITFNPPKPPPFEWENIGDSNYYYDATAYVSGVDEYVQLSIWINPGTPPPTDPGTPPPTNPDPPPGGGDPDPPPSNDPPPHQFKDNTSTKTMKDRLRGFIDSFFFPSTHFWIWL